MELGITYFCIHIFIYFYNNHGLLLESEKHSASNIKQGEMKKNNKVLQVSDIYYIQKQQARRQRHIKNGNCEKEAFA